ncbi:MAG TPA: SHOCT domain-containing protein [Candidatus Dormibacteraeota bacterium]
MGFHLLWFMGVIVVLMVVGGVALVAFLVMRPRPTSPVTFPAMRETPLQILDRRFAAGEIDAENYKRGRDLLTGAGPKS